MLVNSDDVFEKARAVNKKFDEDFVPIEHNRQFHEKCMMDLTPVYNGVRREKTVDLEKARGSINPVAELEKIVNGGSKTRAYKKVCHFCNCGIFVCRCLKV